MMDFFYKPETKFCIGIVIPKSDIMASINKMSRYILGAIFLFTLIALALGLAVSKSLSRSLSFLAEQVERVGRLDLSSNAEVRSRLIEIFKISVAVSAMRTGLRSFKKYVPPTWSCSSMNRAKRRCWKANSGS